MNAPPCICPKNNEGLRTATDPKCFDHAQWNRHPSDYIVRLRIPHRAKIAAATLTAAAAITALSATPAQAAAKYISVCNSSYSAGEIRAFNTHISPNYSKTLYPGQCSSSVRDDGGWARVDVDPAGGWVDVDSWLKRKNSEPWSTCYEAENHASDPFSGPDQSLPLTTYWNFQYNGCSIA
jgi:hypothetical protein